MYGRTSIGQLYIWQQLLEMPAIYYFLASIFLNIKVSPLFFYISAGRVRAVCKFSPNIEFLQLEVVLGRWWLMAFMLLYVMIKMTIVNFYENGKMIENNEKHDEEYEKMQQKCAKALLA